MPRILVTRRLPQSALDLLFDAFGAVSVDIYPEDQVIPRDELLARVRGVDGLLPMLTEQVNGELLEAAGPQLRVIANYAVGYNNVDVKAATARKIPVTNTPDVLTETTADLAWALILGASRRIGETERFLRAGKWQNWSPGLMLGVDVHGKTLGIFGMGRIGSAVARRAAGFNMRVIYHARNHVDAALENELNAIYVDKATLLAESDIISIHAPLSPETNHAFSDDEFNAMKPTSVLVNTSRGPLVDEPALAKALATGEIFSAGIDVFEKEPEIHAELLALENALLVPHIGSATRETRTKMAEVAANNLVAVLQGRAPANCVNPEVL